MKTIVIYDDTGKKSEVIADIIGDKGFADVMVKKRHLEDSLRETVEKVYQGMIWRKVRSTYEFSEIIKELEIYNSEEYKVLHFFSNYYILDFEKAALSLKKLEYIDEPFCITDGKRAVAAMFNSSDEYIAFCKKIVSGMKPWDAAKSIFDTFEIEGVVDISVFSNFIQCVTGNFDSRYFNSLEGNEYTIVKSSVKKEKIKAEYMYYQLLPEDMRYWFVMPFNYQENDEGASYTMERLHVTDLAIKWVHGSMDEAEFDELLDKFFFFFKSRHYRECSKDEYLKVSNDLFTDKVNKRIEQLKALPQYGVIKGMVESSGQDTIDTIVSRYFKLKEKVEYKANYAYCLAIGHGDPCFSNTLYNKATKTLKFIDPKGAITEEELWTNPYYDIAKLSHSICGNYDFFNNGLVEIKVNSKLEHSIEVPFDNSKYVDIFRRKAEENGYDYWSIRLYEASLFLSMLPLHIDNPYKVFGFILNANFILKEIEESV